ncbi:hypothetical protein E2C01_096750 [Portunus trituberculatus]|uniref:Uncharacterized protein n=1 Tax=Portunus trituberculatus TaxID=210409 RepID=A0A5B7JTB6_PORTR|nr:hypothetical protein [Portunus trituberculatus]
MPHRNAEGTATTSAASLSRYSGRGGGVAAPSPLPAPHPRTLLAHPPDAPQHFMELINVPFG